MLVYGDISTMKDVRDRRHFWKCCGWWLHANAQAVLSEAYAPKSPCMHKATRLI